MMLPSIFGENLLDGFFDFPVFDDKAIQKAQRELYGHNSTNIMKTDVQEHDNHYEVYVDLPGFKKEELALELKDGYLTINAAKQFNKDEKEEKTGKFVRRERYAGSMSRSFYIGEEIKQEDIHAKYENGVLNLSIPKVEEKKPEMEEKKYITIEG